jgi:transposase-like protein
MQRKSFSADVKAKVAIEAIKALKTANEIAGEYDCHPAQVSTWRKEFLEHAAELFENKRDKKKSSGEAEKEQLYQQIGELQVQLTWLKKKSSQLR